MLAPMWGPAERERLAALLDDRTCCLGSDPAASVVSPEQQVWGVDGLYVCDSSVFVTSAGYNPTLTLAALAHRAATILTT
jgi:choline dehydrogenase-like flavoprotein